MFFVVWAKPLRIWQIVLTLLAFCAPFVSSYTTDNIRRSTLGWTTPKYSELREINGLLISEYLRPHEHGKGNYYWGQVQLSDGPIFRFTCIPSVGDPSCAYIYGRGRDPNIGKHFIFRYFDWPNRDGPIHVLMSISGIGRYSHVSALNYADSVQRIEDYRESANRPSAPTIVSGILLVLLVPGLIWRLIAGRDPDPPKSAKRAVELSGI